MSYCFSEMAFETREFGYDVSGALIARRPSILLAQEFVG
jgi:hypothetical protein